MGWHNFAGITTGRDAQGRAFTDIKYKKASAEFSFDNRMREHLKNIGGIALTEDLVMHMEAMGMSNKIHISHGVPIMFAEDLFVSQTELLDTKVLEPLLDTTYLSQVPIRDIPWDISATSFSALAVGGGVDVGVGIPWTAQNNGQLQTASTSLDKTVNPVREVGMAVQITQRELAQSARLLMDLDTQQAIAIQTKMQNAFDQMAWVGDSSSGFSTSGLLNSPAVTSATIQSIGGTGNWTSTTSPATILSDVNLAIQYMWKASGLTIMPDTMLLSTDKLGTNFFNPVTVSGTPINSTLKTWLEQQAFSTLRGVKLNIDTNKWISASALGAGGTQRMVLYANNARWMRYNIAPLRAFPTSFDGLNIKRPYAGAIGAVEILFPASVFYFDGV